MTTSLATAPYPPHCKAILQSFLELIEERGWSQAEAARKVKHGPHQRALSDSALSQLFGGTYRADPVNLCKAIARTIDHERGRALYQRDGFARTRLYKTLIELADLAVVTQRIVCLHGGLLCGKSTAAAALAEEYSRAAVVTLTMPYADTYGAFVRRLARVRGIPLKGSLSDLREAIIASLDGTHLLVIDEFHQPLVSYAPRQALRTMEFIREINDISRCGILLVGATTGFAVLSSDPAYQRFAAGLSAVDVCAPAHDMRLVSEDDLAAVAAAFGLPYDADRIEQCRRIVEDHNAARLFDILRLAAGNAERRKLTLAWSHVADITQPTLSLAA
ncbi:MAG TPA: AAA family ATPase [Bacteroidia bacterium]|nr:AAA family ATPase [Bacteroidia bacterium]